MWGNHSGMPAFATISMIGVVALFGGAVRAQRPCSVTPLLESPRAAHIFTAQQEQALGDVEAGWVETNYHVVQDVGLAVHLNQNWSADDGWQVAGKQRSFVLVGL
jgi:hypothetical protein